MRKLNEYEVGFSPTDMIHMPEQHNKAKLSLMLQCEVVKALVLTGTDQSLSP